MDSIPFDSFQRRVVNRLKARVASIREEAAKAERLTLDEIQAFITDVAKEAGIDVDAPGQKWVMKDDWSGLYYPEPPAPPATPEPPAPETPPVPDAEA